MAAYFTLLFGIFLGCSTEPMDAPFSDVEGLLLYEVDDVYRSGRKLHVISDPCALKYPHSIGSGLWQSSLELLDFFKGMLPFAPKV